MKTQTEPSGIFCKKCNGEMIRDGHTASGSQRYRCKECATRTSVPPMADISQLPAVLKGLRTRKNITLENAANFCGKNRAWLSRIESGNRSISLEDLLELARGYQTRASEILLLLENRQAN